ncbi:MAG: hypothetical protein JNG89_03040 [Planctomycetaceae bacterium]|nr:hypothetical protein [Planctomycetaceae bacterium]
MSKTAATICGAVVWLAATQSASAADLLRVEGVTWGYDGSVVPNAFNPVSFELFNDSNDPMNLPLRLVRSNGIEAVDAPISIMPRDQPVFLAPQSSRRVQLFAYVQSSAGDFMLSWGNDPSQRLDLTSNQLQNGPPATVILYDSDAVLPRGTGLPRFDEAYFPVSASGATGLAAVVLDHSPRWQSTQQQAFLDWIKAGGIVHLLQPTVGETPSFEGELAVLNSPLDEQRVGAGRIVRHAVAMAELNQDFAVANILPRNPLQRKPAPETPEVQDPNQQYYSGAYVDWDIAMQVVSRVKRMTRPDHNWALIYLMSLAYLLLIFPGCWLIGRRRADYRLTYGVMLGAVALFSVGFKQVGQRGYGEQTAMHAMTIAQPLDGGRLMFRQWGNLFVTDGDDYRITHDGSGLLYSSGQSNEAVRGWIVSPPAGEFIADVPPFSSRTLACAGVSKSGGFTPIVDELKIGDRLDALRVHLDPPLPTTDVPVTALALYRDQMYTLTPEEGGYRLVAAERPFSTALESETWMQQTYYYGGFDDSEISENELFKSGMLPLVAANANIADEPSLKQFQLSGDRVRVYLFTEMPEALFPTLSFADAPDRPVTPKRAGRVLYVFDVFPPE